MITPARHALPLSAQVRWNLKGLFGGGGAPAAPTPAPPPVMPDMNAPDVMAAQRLALNKAMSGGRRSTQLTTPLAAGAPYSGTAAGG